MLKKILRYLDLTETVISVHYICCGPQYFIISSPCTREEFESGKYDKNRLEDYVNACIDMQIRSLPLEGIEKSVLYLDYELKDVLVDRSCDLW